PVSVHEPVFEAPAGEPVSPIGPAESGERLEFVPRQLPANHPTATRLDARRRRTVGHAAGAPHRSPRLNGLRALGSVLPSVILAVCLRRTSVLDRVAKGTARRASEAKRRFARTFSRAALAAGTSQSLPQEPDTSEYKLQQPNYRIDVAHEL